jgi:ubiquinone/menaquinone biosynthesis C-methylase UbiE
MNLTGDQEAIRIRNEYARRDGRGFSQIIYRYSNPAFMFHMQEREWAILLSLRREGIDLTGSKILEVGCGNGHILQRFIEFGARVAVGIDLMGSRVGQGRKSYPNLHLHQGDAAFLPFGNAGFDLVMQFTCLSSVMEPTMRRQIASEMWRVLRPGGVILFYDLRPISIFSRLFIRALRQFKLEGKFVREDIFQEYVRNPTPTQPLAIKEIRSLFSQGDMNCRTLSLDFSVARLAELSHWLASVLSCLPCLRTHYLVIVRKPFLDQRVGD